jgi:hypothetical protein
MRLALTGPDTARYPLPTFVRSDSDHDGRDDSDEPVGSLSLAWACCLSGRVVPRQWACRQMRGGRARLREGADDLPERGVKSRPSPLRGEVTAAAGCSNRSCRTGWCNVPLAAWPRQLAWRQCLTVSTVDIVLTGGLHTVSACSVAGMLMHTEQRQNLYTRSGFVATARIPLSLFIQWIIISEQQLQRLYFQMLLLY